jgi:hypothetical protein
MKRPQPPNITPYAREIEEAQRRGLHPNVRIFCGPNAWDRARRHRERFGEASATLLPPYIAPLDLRWPRLSDVVVDISGADGQVIRELANALVRDGAHVVYMLDPQKPERNLRVIRKRSGK